MGRSARVLGLLRPYALLFVANIFVTVVASLMDGATFVLLIPFTRALFGQQALPATGGSTVETVLAKVAGPWLAAGAPETARRNVVLVLLVTLVVKNVATYAAAMSSVAIEEGVVRDLRVRLFRHLQTLPLGFFQRTRAGQLLARVISDTDQVKTAVTAALASFLRNASLILVYVAILFGLSWRLTLLALVLAPLLALIIRPVIARVRRRSREQAEDRGELTSLVSEMVSSVKLVRAYVAEAFEIERFRRLADQYRMRVLRAQGASTLMSPLSEVFAGIVIVLLFSVGARLALGASAAGGLPPAVFIAFLIVALRLMSPVKAAAQYPTIMAGAVAAADRVFEVLDVPADEGDHPDATEARFREEIEYRGVSFCYDGEAPVLQDVNLAVRRGQVVAIVGAWGGGKDDARRPAPAFLRAHGGRDPEGGRAGDAVHAREPAAPHGDRVAGDDSPELHGACQHRLRPRRLRPGAGRGRGPRRERPRLHRPAPARRRHAAGRARHPAQRRGAPAHRDRAGPAARSSHPHPRRGDERARHGGRAPRAGGDRPADPAPHGTRHRTPARHGAARGRDRGARRGTHRRARHPRDALRRRGTVPPAVRPAVPRLTCCRASRSSATPSSSTTPSSRRYARSSASATRWW